MVRRKRAIEVDLQAAIRGVPEAIMLLGPVLTLWLWVLGALYQLLFFIPNDWQWLAVHQVGGFQQSHVHWRARTLLALLLSFPITLALYLRLKKLIGTQG